MTDTIDKREEYRGLLKSGICTVTFTKVSGDTRVMKCTLNPAFIPQLQIPASLESQTETERSAEVLRVFDTEAQGWRSFRIDSVTDFKVGA
jgi:hypothetical protein